MRLGTVIRQWRKAEKLSLNQVSQDIGIKLMTLQRIEKGTQCSGETLTVVLKWLFSTNDK